MSTQHSNFRKYFFEFLSIFIGISLAFGLQKWNDNNQELRAETKILQEMKNGLKLDLVDVKQNQKGHEVGIKACNYFRQIIDNQVVAQDSFYENYFSLWRDYISVQNKSGYESLKAKGFELLQNDSLGFEIIELYDFYYEIIEKLEEQYSEGQFNENYFIPMNEIFAPYYVFDEKGKITHIQQPIDISQKEKKILLSYIFRIEINRAYNQRYYKMLEGKLENLITKIEMELER